MHPILRFAKTAYVESQNLKPLLRSYTNPDDFISRMVKSGELIRLKNCFFLIIDIDYANAFEFSGIKSMLKKITIYSQVTLLLSTVAFANNPPSKTLALYNNSKETIYPVIEAPILGVDPWMQALFKITDVTHNPFQTTHIYRAYLNTTEGGIPPGGKLTITVPFYSQLTQNPDGGSTSDQYVDWWNGMRVYFYAISE